MFEWQVHPNWYKPWHWLPWYHYDTGTEDLGYARFRTNDHWFGFLIWQFHYWTFE